MSYYLLLGGLGAGLVLSQTITFLRRAHELLVESDKRREASFNAKRLEITAGFEKLAENLKGEVAKEHQKQWEFLHEKASVLDQKLSLVLSKITTSSFTSNGTYKTSVGIDNPGIEQVKVMSKIIDEGSGVLSNHYKDLLKKYGTRKSDLVDPNPEEHKVHPEPVPEHLTADIIRDESKTKKTSEIERVRCSQSFVPISKPAPEPALDPPAIEECEKVLNAPKIENYAIN